jgi:hypothetical protein
MPARARGKIPTTTEAAMRHTKISRHGYQYVTLWPTEATHADEVGQRRHNAARRRGQRDIRGLAAADRLEADQLGARGERVVADAEVLTWSAATKYVRDKRPDVGPWYVRAAHRNSDRLIVHPGDDPAGWYVLVVRYAGKVEPIRDEFYRATLTYRIVGYLRGVDAMRDEYRTDPTLAHRDEAWFVYQTHLRPWNDRRRDVPLP